MTRRAQALPGMVLLLAVFGAQAAPMGYVINSDSPADTGFDALYRVDLATGVATHVGDVGYGDVEGLALSPQGVLYGADDGTETLIIIDTQTGQGSPVNNTASNLTQGSNGLQLGADYDFGLSFDAQGNLWLSSDITGEIWQVDPQTGNVIQRVAAPSTVSSTTGEDGAKSAANPGALTGLAACGSDVYGVGSQGDESLYDRAQTGTPVLLGPLDDSLVFGDAGLDYDANGTLWGVADRSADLDGNPLNEPSIIFTLNPVTGAATQVATTIVGVESLAIAPPSASCQAQADPPIPATGPGGLAALLSSMAAAGLWALRRRRPVPVR